MTYYHHLIKSAPAYGALTTAWIAATSETDTTIISALNTLETDLTTYGLTAKIKALYPMVGGSAAKHKFNFLDARDLDAAFRLTFSGGWTHSSTGAKPNGTNAYADTKFNPFTQSLSINSAHISYYRRNVSSGTLIGSLTNAATVLRFTLIPDYGGGYGNISEIISTNAQQAGTAITELGLINGNRNSSTAFKIFANSTLKQTVTRTSFTQPSNTFYIGACHEAASATAYNSGECAFASIGDGLTDTEAANFYTAVQAFQTTLSRQV